MPYKIYYYREYFHRGRYYKEIQTKIVNDYKEFVKHHDVIQVVDIDGNEIDFK